jgi:hypothetical protein
MFGKTRKLKAIILVLKDVATTNIFIEKEMRISFCLTYNLEILNGKFGYDARGDFYFY